MLRLFNTLSRKIEDFIPLNSEQVTMYICGPTVYDYTHIGHLKKYIGDDLLRRLLEVNEYKVKSVMNITDVGHLTSDEDSGDDKLEKGARERNMSVWEVAKFFEDYFLKTTDQVNIIRPDIIAKATDHISEQVKLIQKLEKNGFIYVTEEAIYFDISRFPDYTKLSGQKLEDKNLASRDEVIVDKNKKNPQDFALWFFTVGHFKDHQMHWSSPWGEGFPGWHIECSAMSMEYLGDTIDIHTGGVDHISVHHTNEIAQSEAATGKQFVRYWIHHDFLLVDGEKMSKSKKNFYKLEDIKERGFEPLALRYLFLTAHYRDKINFTWESLGAVQHALDNLRNEVRLWEQPKGDLSNFWHQFIEAANNDLGIPQAVAVMWKMIASDTPTSSKARDLLEMDKILGLGLDQYIATPLEIPKQVQDLITSRENARKEKDFKRSDELRSEIKKLGYEIEDMSEGYKIKKA